MYKCLETRRAVQELNECVVVLQGSMPYAPPNVLPYEEEDDDRAMKCVGFGLPDDRANAHYLLLSQCGDRPRRDLAAG